MNSEEKTTLIEDIKMTENAIFSLCKERLKELGTNLSSELDKQINDLKDELDFKTEMYVQDDLTLDKKTFLNNLVRFRGANDFRASLMYEG